MDCRYYSPQLGCPDIFGAPDMHVGLEDTVLLESEADTMGSGLGSGNRTTTELDQELVMDPDMEQLFKEFLDEDTEGGGSVTSNSEEWEFARPRPGKQPYHYQIRDTSHKAFYLRDNSLVAANLQVNNAIQEEKISVVPNRVLERKKCPLILGIKGGTQGLSCGTAEQPKLQLEDVHLLDLFHNDEAAKPFTFFKTYNGSTHRFEAAAYPGWFLCTSPQANEPIGLTAQPGEVTITDFYFQRK